jgi:3-mercaptopyruvate sulfurtransferase SseA
MHHMEQPYNWEAEAKRLLRAELVRSGVTYEKLVERLEALGIQDNKLAIANRVSRGKFSFVFFLQCMRALGVSDVRVGDRTPRE